MPSRNKKAAVGRAVMTAVNCLLILLILIFSVILALSSLKGGTFSFFGNSWYYYQSDVMSGEVERNELLFISDDSPADFEPDDLVAFYASDSQGSRVIQIARLLSAEGTQYQVTEADGQAFTLDSTETVFIGRISFHSKLLGHLVQQMRTEEGRKIFLGWSVALLLFACGLSILLHVRSDRRLQQLEADAVSYPDGDYDDGYSEYADEYTDTYREDEDGYEDADDDYPETQTPGVRFDRAPLYTPPVRIYDEEPEKSDAYEEETDEPLPAVDETNMELIAASTESEDEEDVDFDAIFREIKRQIKKE